MDCECWHWVSQFSHLIAVGWRFAASVHISLASWSCAFDISRHCRQVKRTHPDLRRAAVKPLPDDADGHYGAGLLFSRFAGLRPAGCVRGPGARPSAPLGPTPGASRRYRCEARGRPPRIVTVPRKSADSEIRPIFLPLPLALTYAPYRWSAVTHITTANTRAHRRHPPPPVPT